MLSLHSLIEEIQRLRVVVAEALQRLYVRADAFKGWSDIEVEVFMDIDEAWQYLGRGEKKTG